MKNLSILLVLLILTLIINAQTTPPTIQWQRSLGGTKFDLPNSIQQTIDGGYIIAGCSYSNDGDVTGHHGDTAHCDYWVVKLDTSGNIQWQKSLGGTFDDMACSVQQTNDDGYIVAGYSYSNDGDVTGHHGDSASFDIWVVKLDTIGNIQWQKSLGGSGNDGASSVIQTIDGGYIVAGGSLSNDGDVTGNHPYGLGGNSSDCWVVKLDSAGNIQWQKSLGGSLDETIASIQQTKDGGFICAGLTDSNDGDVSGNNGSNDFWVVKLNSSGNIQWQKCLGGTGDEFGYSIKQTIDGGYIVAGSTQSNDGDVSGLHAPSNYTMDYWILKIDSVGNLQWQKCLGGSYSDGATTIQQTNDGGYIIGGGSQSNDGDVIGHHGLPGPTNDDYWVIKLDSARNIQWQKSLGGTNRDTYSCPPLYQTQDGGNIIATGSMSNNGDVSGNHGGYDYWIVKLGPAPLCIKKQKTGSIISIYPNPADRNFTVNVPVDTKYIEISNSLGEILGKRNVYHQSELHFDIKDDGIYFVRIVTGRESITRKIVISNE